MDEDGGWYEIAKNAENAEQLPKDGVEFLAYDSRTKKQDVCKVVEWSDGKSFVFPVQSDGEFGPFEDEFGHNQSDITHWRHLPEPPKV
jgi:hypothetical protein